MVPDFSLLDVNTTSSSYNELVSPRDYLQHVSGWYFADATCFFCGVQFGLLNQMQDELDASYPALGIKIIGCNRDGEESGNTSITAGRDIPWLQDLDSDGDGASDVWTSWEVTLRDVIILNAENIRIETFNLTENPLLFQENYDMLRQIFIDAATIAGDMNLDGVVDQFDIAPFVDLLSSGGFSVAADVNQDGIVNLRDVKPFVDLLFGP